MRPDRSATVVAVAAGAFFVAVGAWSLLAPRSFFDTLATFEPYNAHFLRDVGAFQIGLGAVLLLAVRRRDALFVALAGVGAGSLAHVVAHVIDRNAGGNPAVDIPLLAVLTLALLGTATTRTRGSGSGSTR